MSTDKKSIGGHTATVVLGVSKSDVPAVSALESALSALSEAMSDLSRTRQDLQSTLTPHLTQDFTTSKLSTSEPNADAMPGDWSQVVRQIRQAVEQAREINADFRSLQNGIAA